MSQSYSITSHYLAKNQSAYAYLRINDILIAGISDMPSVNIQSDIFTYEESDEEDIN